MPHISKYGICCHDSVHDADDLRKTDEHNVLPFVRLAVVSAIEVSHQTWW